MTKRHDNEAWYGDPAPAAKAVQQSDPFSESTVRPDCEGTIVNSPYNKPGPRGYKTAESLGIHRSPSVVDSHLNRLVEDTKKRK